MRALLGFAGPAAKIEQASAVPWASATFQGSRHDIRMAFAGEKARDDASAFFDQICDAEFAIAGHIVADLAIDERHMCFDPQTGQTRVTATLSALVIEDW
ncbi:MAG TPA: hypothetical protein VF509_10560 [Sphingobium sp.]